MLSLLDRRGGTHVLDHHDGEPVAQALVRNGIPPTSVVVYREASSAIVPDDSPLSTDVRYTAHLIEGYDIGRIRELYNMSGPSSERQSDFISRFLDVEPNGSLHMEQRQSDVDTLANDVETRVHETIRHYGLAAGGSSVILGLSGGVDSGSLLMMLSRYRDILPDEVVHIKAATFEDFDSQDSEAFIYAKELSERFEVDHLSIEATKAEQVFHLSRPLAQILMLLMESDDAHIAMYVDHHTTRRVLEVCAEENSADAIALGLHTTDLLAGLLNSWTTGHGVGPIPERVIGDHRYILPLAFIPKRELHVYYTAMLGHMPKQTTPNQWEFNPTDRNFYYYIADHLQWLWPGIQYWTFTADNGQIDTSPTFLTCENCEASVRDTKMALWSGLCDVCVVLDKYGWLHRQ